MPIGYRIDTDRRLVIASGQGIVTDQDVFGYQHEVWSRLDLTGYDELIDMSAVQRIDPPSSQRIMELAQLSVMADAGAPASKLAIIAPGDLAFGLGRMYQVYRNLESGSSKQVEVFRSSREALAFLGVSDEPPASC